MNDYWGHAIVMTIAFLAFAFVVYRKIGAKPPMCLCPNCEGVMDLPVEQTIYCPRCGLHTSDSRKAI